MKNKMYGLFIVVSFVTVIPLTALRAQATLGESVDSVQSDRKAFSAVQNATLIRKGYTVQELNSESNVVREFITSTGAVFAIAWNGQSHPDLTSLLGSYVGEYQQALRQNPRHRGKRHFQVKTDRIVVEKWGHMRNMQGRAYIPALIPSGVSINEIR